MKQLSIRISDGRGRLDEAFLIDWTAATTQRGAIKKWVRDLVMKRIGDGRGYTAEISIKEEERP